MRNPPRWITTKWGEHDNYECACPTTVGTQCQFKTLDKGEMINHAREMHPRPWEGNDPTLEGSLVGVEFASVEAKALAFEEDLTVADFFSATATGKGGFTVADVERIARARAEAAPATPDQE